MHQRLMPSETKTMDCIKVYRSPIINLADASVRLFEMEEAMIDWKRVTDLKDEIGSEDFEEVVPLFIEEVSEITERLRNDPKLDQLENDLHSLKGSAMNLGFTEFSTLCSKGESMAAKGDAISVDIATILTSFDNSRDVFLAGLDHGKAA